MLQACFGNCVDDGTCGAVVATSCYYTIDMQDSFGDGWNGASIDVSRGYSHMAYKQNTHQHGFKCAPLDFEVI